MNTYKVTAIIDECRIMVTPNWQWNKPDGQILSSDSLIILGYNLTPKNNDSNNKIREKLVELLLNKKVVLSNPQLIEENNSNELGFNVSVDDVDICYLLFS